MNFLKNLFTSKKEKSEKKKTTDLVHAPLQRQAGLFFRPGRSGFKISLGA